MTDIFSLRRDFSLQMLDEKEVNHNPIQQFETWFDEALKSDILEANAMTLSTAGLDAKPSSRIVLLKQITPDGFVFFTNYKSKKALQLAENPFCALNFVWHELERQVRIEGIAEKILFHDSDRYFEMRPLKSKLGAWASPQSEVIPDRLFIENLMEDFEQKFAGKEIRRPENWGGYIVKPSLFEFWQGRPNRLHDRIQYRPDTEPNWIVERLAP